MAKVVACPICRKRLGPFDTNARKTAVQQADEAMKKHMKDEHNA